MGPCEIFPIHVCMLIDIVFFYVFLGNHIVEISKVFLKDSPIKYINNKTQEIWLKIGKKIFGVYPINYWRLDGWINC